MQGCSNQLHDHAAGVEPRGAGIADGVSVQRGFGGGESEEARVFVGLGRG